jgi:hypothetical protein
MQGRAISHTVGQIDRYLTHELVKESGTPEDCAGWKDSSMLSEAKRLSQLRINVEAEKLNQDAFFDEMEHRPGGAQMTLPAGWQRRFCGGAVLKHLAKRGAWAHPHTPIWNVRADKSMIAGHNEIDSPEFLAFVRQLYHDATEFPVARE